MKMHQRAAYLIAGCLAAGSACSAAQAGNTDKSAYTLFSPTPDANLRDFSPDRPARSISPYTVDAGHFQIESDCLNVTQSRRDGIATHTLVLADPVLKLGLTNAVDLEVTLGGFNTLRVFDIATGARLDGGRGYGDTTFTTKINLLGNDDGKVALALAPYVIAPTGARGITAGQVEGGVIAPLAIKLPQDYALTLQTEVDDLANQNRPGTHVAFTNIVEVSHPVPGLKDLTAYAELYSQVTPAKHEDNQYTFDVALAYQIGSNTQLDVGANFGLNRGAPDAQVYSGVAQRF